MREGEPGGEIRTARTLVAGVLLLSVAPVILGASAANASGASRVLVHWLIEWSAVLVALFTAFLGLLYLGARRDPLVYTITGASVACGVWGAVHATASMGLLSSAGPEDLVPWSWALGRTARALVLTSGAACILLGWRQAPASRWSWTLAGGTVVGALAFAFLTVLVEASVPRAHFVESLVKRPWDVPALMLFVIGGLVIYPLLVRRQPSLLSKSLLLGAVPDVLSSLYMAFGSSAIYDRNFFTAHGLMLTGSLVPLSGICLELVQSYRREIAATGSMTKLLSELRSVEDELRSKEAKLEQLTNNIREIFWIAAPDGSKTYYASPAYEEIFGLDLKDLYRDAWDFLSIVHPDDRRMMKDLVHPGDPSEFDVEYRIVRDGGEIAWLRTRGFPVRDEEGAVYRLVGVTEDVTARKFAEIELRKSEARTRALLRAMPDLMFRVNRSGIILDYHAQPTTHLYKPPSTFLGARMQDVLPELSEPFLRSLERALREGVVTSFEYRLDCAGRPGLFEARLAPSSEDEVLVVVRDITEPMRLQREILEISNREQERIGHDLHDGISQQLTGIALLCRVLEKQLDARGLPEAERARQIEELVEETLSQTKSLARGLAAVEIDAAGLAAALEDLAYATEKVHKVRCRCRFDPDVAVASRAEAVHLYRIAQEAVSNALRHGSPTRIGIELASGNGRLRLSIQDDGTGIDNLSDSRGMGLHIMRYRSRMIQGALEIRRAPGRGTIVSCEWSQAAPRVASTL